MAVDATVLKAVQDAEISATMDEIRRNFREGTSDMTSALLAQLGPDSGLNQGEAQATMTTTAVEFTLWQRDTGVPSKVSYDQLEHRLKVRFEPDYPNEKLRGQLVWSAAPLPLAFQGKLLCPLHQQSERRQEMTDLGYGAFHCRADDISDAWSLDLHIRVKHPGLFKRLERQREDDNRNAQMELMRQQTAAMQAMAAGMGALPAVGGAPDGQVLPEDHPRRTRRVRGPDGKLHRPR